MIYMRDGKLLVSADGKLCSSCCIEYGIDCDDCEPDPFPDSQTPKYIDVTFSGVLLCDGASWPGDVNLNTTWQLTQELACLWRYLDANWHIALGLYDVYPGLGEILADDAETTVDYFEKTFSNCTYPGVDISNFYTVGNCGVFVKGYDGLANWNAG